MSEKLNQARGADFRFLPAMRAAMVEKPTALLPSLKKKKRRGLRKVMREIARPFEQVSRVLRNRAGFGGERPAKLTTGQLVHRSKRRLQPEFGKNDAKQGASAMTHEPCECVSALAQQEWLSQQIAQLRAKMDDLHAIQVDMLGRLRSQSRARLRRRRNALAGTRAIHGAPASGPAEGQRWPDLPNEWQTTALRRAKRQPIPIADGLLLIGLDDRNVAVPACDFTLVATLIDHPLYEPGVTAVLERFAADKSHVIDIGANIGLHSITMARAMKPKGTLLALEPAPKTFEALKASLLLSGVLPRADARRLAAGEREGEMTLHGHSVSVQNSLFGDPCAETQQIIVPVVALDTLIPAGTEVDLVKIDAGGAEFDILKGMRRILGEAPDITLVMQFSAAHFERFGVSPSELVEFLAGSGLGPQRICDVTGQLEPFDLNRILGLPGAPVLFRRAMPVATGGRKGSP